MRYSARSQRNHVAGFGVDDATAHVLIEGSHKLKYMNLSRTS
ncbi:unnamed protein product, partial [Brassica rapa subsp. narinosa]